MRLVYVVNVYAAFVSRGFSTSAEGGLTVIYKPQSIKTHESMQEKQSFNKMGGEDLKEMQ